MISLNNKPWIRARVRFNISWCHQHYLRHIYWVELDWKSFGPPPIKQRSDSAQELCSYLSWRVLYFIPFTCWDKKNAVLWSKYKFFVTFQCHEIIESLKLNDQNSWINLFMRHSTASSSSSSSSSPALEMPTSTTTCFSDRLWIEGYGYQMRMLWSTDEVYGGLRIAKFMTLKRFEKLAGIFTLMIEPNTFQKNIQIMTSCIWSDHGREIPGGRGGTRPPTILKVGTQYQMSPPPTFLGLYDYSLKWGPYLLSWAGAVIFVCLSASYFKQNPLRE